MNGQQLGSYSYCLRNTGFAELDCDLRQKEVHNGKDQEVISLPRALLFIAGTRLSTHTYAYCKPQLPPHVFPPRLTHAVLGDAVLRLRLDLAGVIDYVPSSRRRLPSAVVATPVGRVSALASPAL